MTAKYVLDGHTAVECNNLLDWARWFETAERRVAEDNIAGVRVSTVFLGLDHAFGGDTPLLFETMVFGGARDQDQLRYSTWEQAEAGHKAMVERIKKGD